MKFSVLAILHLMMVSAAVPTYQTNSILGASSSTVHSRKMKSGGKGGKGGTKSPKASKSPKSSTCIKPDTQYDYILVGDSNIFSGEGTSSLPFLQCVNPDHQQYNPNNEALLNSIANYQTEPCLMMGDGILIDFGHATLDFALYASGIETSLVGTSNADAAINTIPLNTPNRLDVSKIKTLILVVPTSLTPDEQTALHDFMMSGGRVIFINEGTPLGDASATFVNGMLSNPLFNADTIYDGGRNDVTRGMNAVTWVPPNLPICASDGRSISTGAGSLELVSFNTPTFAPGTAVIAADNIER